MENMLAYFSMHVAMMIAAMILDWTIGDPPTKFHPVGWMGKGIAFFWGRRPRGGNLILFIWGILLVALGLITTLTLTWPLQRFLLPAKGYHRVISAIIVALPLSLSLSIRGLLRAAGDVGHALDAGDVQEAQKIVRKSLVSRSLDKADASMLSSATIESLSENFTDSIVGPLLCFAVGGLPAAWAYRFINTADAMLGYHDTHYEWGGKCAARCDDILNFIPARIAGLILVATASLGGYDGRGALRTIRHDAQNCQSPNSGWTMAAAAGALGVRLEKPHHYVLNASGRIPTAKDLHHGIILIRRSTLLMISMPVLSILIIYGISFFSL